MILIQLIISIMYLDDIFVTKYLLWSCQDDYTVYLAEFIFRNELNSHITRFNEIMSKVLLLIFCIINKPGLKIACSLAAQAHADLFLRHIFTPS